MKRIKEITDKEILQIEGMSQAKPRYTSRAILLNENNEIAVMYTSVYQLYSLPGGGIEEGESREDALLREIREETGYNAIILDELGYIYENRAHADYTQISYYFVAKVVGEQQDIRLTQMEKSNKITMGWYSFQEAVHYIGDVIHEVTQRKYIQAKDMAALREYELMKLSK